MPATVMRPPATAAAEVVEVGSGMCSSLKSPLKAGMVYIFAMTTIFLALLIKPLVFLALFSFTAFCRILVQRHMKDSRIKRILLFKLRKDL